MDRTYSKNGLQLTESFEGCKLVAYQDSKGVWTIGYGHTFGVYQGMVITQEQAEQYLQMDVRLAEHAVNMLVKAELSQDEFDALVDFTFNCGVTAFATSTLHGKLNIGDYEGAAKEFERWDKSGGKIVAGLLRRRRSEADLFKQGMQHAETETA